MHVKYNIENDRFCISKEPVNFDFAARHYGPEYFRYISVGMSLKEANEYLVHYPHEACFEITKRCNCSCPICISESSFEKDIFLPFDHIMRILDELPKEICRVTFTGGEPTFHPQIKDLINSTIEMGYSVVLSSNGTNPSIIRDILPNNGSAVVAISVHGPENFHDKYVGMKGAFKKALSSIELAIGLFHYVHVYSTIIHSNLRHLRELAIIIDDLAVKEHRLCLVKRNGRLKEKVATLDEVKSVFPCLSSKTRRTFKKEGSPFLFVDVMGNIEVRNAS